MCKQVPDNSHNSWVRNSGFNFKSLVVELLKFFIVLSLRVHLDFKSININKLTSFLGIVFSFFVLENYKENEIRILGMNDEDLLIF